MYKFITIMIIAIASFYSYSTESITKDEPRKWEQCASQMPYGEPIDNVQGDKTKICRRAYALEHDNVAKMPVWVAYVLTPDHSHGCLPRVNSFSTDHSLPVDKRSDPKDYVGSGYDIGHMANAADMEWDVLVEHESFLLSNMSPQLPEFNRGIWKVLETDIRGWAFNRNHAILIYAGPIYDLRKPKVKGLVVSDQYYKIVIDIVTKESLAFKFKHHGVEGSNLTPFLTSVSAIEKDSGLVFAIPGDKTKVNPIWVNDSSAFAKKKAECKV